MPFCPYILSHTNHKFDTKKETLASLNNGTFQAIYKLLNLRL